MGQTRVDLLHLLEDLRDAYPGSLEETLLTEIVANSLDSGARRIVLTADPAQPALLILDDGNGMKRAELARYHDVAASRKSRAKSYRSRPGSRRSRSPGSRPPRRRSRNPLPPRRHGIPEAAINLAVPGRRARKKPMHLGLKLQFESRSESAEPGRLAENIIWINETHPAYRRAAVSRSEGYHIALSAAMALSTVAVEPREQRAFVNAFLTRWGEALDRPPAARSRRRQRSSRRNERR